MPAKKTTIITADDDPQLLRMVTRNLQMEDYEVIGVSDGQQALEQIEARMPDLALLDLNMPRLDGFGVLTRVREFSNLPIIIITARGADQDKIRGLDLGADDYLDEALQCRGTARQSARCLAPLTERRPERHWAWSAGDHDHRRVDD